MAFSISKMKEHNLLVKKMASTENLAYTNIICTGKTGTITTGEMTVRQFFIGAQCQDYDPARVDLMQGTQGKLIKSCIILNNDAKIEMCYKEKLKNAVYTPTGNKTEVAMLNLLYAAGQEPHTLISDRQKHSEIECVIPFNPYSKSQMTVTRVNKGDNKVRVVLKGAPEVVIDHCSHTLTNDMEDPIKFSDELRKQFKERIYGLDLKQKKIEEEEEEDDSFYPYRCIAYAYKDIDSDKWEEMQQQHNNFENHGDRQLINQDLTLVVVFALEDQVRKDVKKSIEKLHEMTIDVRMISGDHLVTAKSTAIKAGIIHKSEADKKYVCMTGEELMDILQEDPRQASPLDIEVNNVYSQDKKHIIEQTIMNCKVLARCNPDQKVAFIAALQTRGDEVAVTGKSITDTKALKNANVSFCMGSGTEIAKDASHIILMDDNFKSVFIATRWGRNILDNIRKFLQFQLCVNIVCCFTVLIGGATLGNSPFSIIQLLWINLIMDTLAAIGLATEPPSLEDHDDHDDHGHQEHDLSRNKDEKIIKEVMWRNVLVQATYQILVLVVMLYSVPFWFSNSAYNLVNTDFFGSGPSSIAMRQHYTILFNTFVMMTLGYQLTCRKLGWSEMNILSHFFNNKWFIGVLLGEFGLQWFIVQFPLFNEIFGTEPLEWSMHITCWVFGLGAIAVNLAAKKVFDNEEHYSKFFKMGMEEDPANQRKKMLFRLQDDMKSRFKKGAVEDSDMTCDSIHEKLLDHHEADGHDHEEEEKE